MTRLLPLLLCAACAGADPAAGRDAVLHDWLVADNAVWLGRDPALLEGKYRRMAADPYDFLRGTTGLYYADVGRVGTERPETAFATTPEAAAVWIVGDPHPENLGTLRPETGPLQTGWIDLDASTWGPWVLDVRRAACGMAMIASQLSGCDAACVDGAARGVAIGYATRIEALAAGGDTPLPDGGFALADLVDEATREGTERKRLDKHTEVGGDGERHLVSDAALDDTGSGFLPLDAEDTRRVGDWKAAWEARTGLRVRDAVRRFGKGVSSWPAFRYLVLYDHGQPGDADDALLDVREVLSPPPIPGAPVAVPRYFADDAQRIEASSATLWPIPDPGAAAVRVANQAYKSLSWSSFYQGLDHVKIGEAWDGGDLDAGGLASLGTYVGAALASAHARGTTASGDPALPVIAADLGGRTGVLADEIAARAGEDLQRTLDDHDRFLGLLDTWGPLLGADALEDVP